MDRKASSFIPNKKCGTEKKPKHFFLSISIFGYHGVNKYGKRGTSSVRMLD